MIRFSKKETGDVGEQYAVDYLKKRKYKIIARNFRTRFGEIDIIAEKRNCIAFVEVKTRHSNPFIAPALAVDKRKQNRIITTASQFCAENNIDKFTRFDVCEVYVDENSLKLIQLNYIEEAFDASR